MPGAVVWVRLPARRRCVLCFPLETYREVGRMRRARRVVRTVVFPVSRNRLAAAWRNCALFRFTHLIAGDSLFFLAKLRKAPWPANPQNQSSTSWNIWDTGIKHVFLSARSSDLRKIPSVKIQLRPSLIHIDMRVSSSSAKKQNIVGLATHLTSRMSYLGYLWMYFCAVHVFTGAN